MDLKSSYTETASVRYSILKAFGLRIRELRLAKKISQEELALRSDLDRSYVGGVERGERNISLENIAKLANALEVDLETMFRGINFVPRPRTKSSL